MFPEHPIQYIPHEGSLVGGHTRNHRLDRGYEEPKQLLTFLGCHDLSLGSGRHALHAVPVVLHARQDVLDDVLGVPSSIREYAG